MPKPPTGTIVARHAGRWYQDIRKKPPGASLYFRIQVQGVRRMIPLETADPREAVRRRDAWLAGIRLSSYERFLQSLRDQGTRAGRELDSLLAGKGVSRSKG
jgi:hypothetical protein